MRCTNSRHPVCLCSWIPAVPNRCCMFGLQMTADPGGRWGEPPVPPIGALTHCFDTSHLCYSRSKSPPSTFGRFHTTRTRSSMCTGCKRWQPHSSVRQQRRHSDTQLRPVLESWQWEFAGSGNVKRKMCLCGAAGSWAGNWSVELDVTSTQSRTELESNILERPASKSRGAWHLPQIKAQALNLELYNKANTHKLICGSGGAGRARRRSLQGQGLRLHRQRTWRGLFSGLLLLLLLLRGCHHRRRQETQGESRRPLSRR